jgi:uncharacterized glyoxalase superfamily protein PhnB
MQPTPRGWPRFSSALVYRDAAAAIDWLCGAFGFEVHLKVEGENGRIVHSELDYGDGRIMVAQEEPDSTPDSKPDSKPDSTRTWRHALRSPLSVNGANTQTLMIYVDDAEAHYARACAHGARIVEALAVHDYGEDHWADRSYGAVDPEGHVWWISQRLRGG